MLEIHRASQASSRWVAESLAASRLTPTQFDALRILLEAGADGLPTGGVGQRMVADDPDLTRLFDRLAARGLVSKTRGTRDRRVVQVRITGAGRRLVKGASATVARRVRGELGPIGARKLRSLAGLLELVQRPARRVRAGQTRPAGRRV